MDGKSAKKVMDYAYEMDRHCHIMYEKLERLLFEKGMSKEEILATNLHLHPNSTSSLAGVIRHFMMDEIKKEQPMNLKTRLSKLRHEGHITDEEYRELIEKVDAFDIDISEPSFTLKQASFVKKYAKSQRAEAIEDYLRKCDECCDYREDAHMGYLISRKALVEIAEELKEQKQ